MIESLSRDLRQALRRLRRSPLFTAVAVLSLALGIGANTAVFGLIRSVLFRPLPVAEPGRLVSIFTSEGNGDPWGSTSYPDYRDLAAERGLFEGVAAYSPSFFSLGRGERLEVVLGERVSDNYFELLGVEAAAGRVFTAAEAAGGAPVAVISHDLWRGRLAGDPAAVGGPIRLNRQSFTVVGVVPPGFHDTFVGLRMDVWVPLAATPLLLPGSTELEERDRRGLFLLGRLAPGVDPAAADAGVATVGERLARAHPATNEERRMSALPASRAGIHPEARQALLVVGFFLLALVGVVLLIACLNLANLLLARAFTRWRETSIRLALGASRGRLVRQLLTESLVLALAGGALGAALAALLARLLGRLPLPVDLPVALEVEIDPQVLLFALLLSLATGVLFGLAPALQASKPDLVPALKADASARGRRHRRFGLRNLLVVAQVATSLFLLIGAALFLRSLGAIQRIDPGFDVEGVVTAALSPEVQGYGEEAGLALYRRLVEGVEASPGVTAAALAESVPLGLGRSSAEVQVPGRETPEEGEEIAFNVVSPRYFEVMGVPLASGRGFDDGDRAGAPLAALVNDTMARRFWPAGALGESFSVDGAGGPFRTVVGVVADTKYQTLGEGPTPFFFLPLEQHYEGAMTLHVATAGDPARMKPELRRRLAEIDPDLPVAAVKTLEEAVGVALLPARAGAAVLAAFGLLALFLAAIGVYGVMSFAVARRTREIGIRMAVGADRRGVLALVVREAMALVLAGLVAGGLAGLAMMRLVLGFLYGVGAADPLSFLSVAALLALVALGAAWLPARRATRVDPVRALRSE